MGSPPEKQGMPEDLKKRWQDCLAQEGDPEERAEEHMIDWAFPPGREGQARRQEWKQWLTRVFRDRDIEAVIRRYYPSNETPESPIQTVDEFLLGRTPVLNGWYGLFDPGHGRAPSWYQEAYDETSPEDQTPAIFVGWYDAWVFCRWARWDGLSCRLPHEDEWEYAAKAGTPSDWDYWWGDEFDATKCNAERRVGRTTKPDERHANSWGFEDMLGNVWEWCEDSYRRAYSRTSESESSARVLRGGSWHSFASDCRSAFRYGLPADSFGRVGLRSARALPRKS
jgi:formylglycine-generating enzyme required for sulfatase activity